MGEAPPCLLPADRIRERVAALAREIEGRCPAPRTILGVLRGAALFCVDLLRAMEGRADLTFVQARSYGKGTASTGDVYLGDFEEEVLRGRRIVVVDTVLESGRTLAAVKAHLESAGASQVFTCVLLEKPAPRAARIRPDFVGFPAPDRFLVGYGLDHAGRWRSLPYIGAIDDVGA